MTYYVKSLNLRKKQTNKSGDFAFNRAFIQCSGYFRVAKAIWYIPTTSLSLCSGSGESRSYVANPGTKGCFYGQASYQFSKKLTGICQSERTVYKRYNRSCLRACSHPWRGAWLKKAVFAKSKSNTATTVLQLGNFLRSITNCFLMDFINFLKR